jgi:3-isopropylmalate/(R)-2-methylmalate dehydratase large subunit
MPATTIEKIIEKHADETISPGKIVWVNIDFRSARDFGGANVVKNLLDNYDSDYIQDKSKTAFTFDTNAPANNIPYADNQHFIRLFARKQNIPLYDVDQGIGTHIAMEKGLVLPGEIAVGTDSHYNILGAIGAFGQGMGDQDIAFIFKAGKTWFEVPESIKFTVKGKLPQGVSARDLTLKIVGILGTDKTLGKAVDFYGSAIDDLDLAERITLASMATETGAISFFLKPNRAVFDYCSERARGRTFTPLWADDDARYSDEIVLDVSHHKPQIALSPSPNKVVDLKEALGRPIDSLFLGSCTNGRYEDFAVVARIMKGHSVSPGLMFKAVPATREVYGRLLKEGIIAQLFNSGVIVSQPGCGGCASGQLGMTGKNEIQLSTSNRNFPGKQGAGETHLVSPDTIAYSAIAGVIANPNA